MFVPRGTFLLFLGFLMDGIGLANSQYIPEWTSLDKRPLPTWYDEAKFGIFMHWGVYSVPSFGSEWFWEYWKQGRADCVQFMKNNYRPGFEYPDFGSQFTAEFFDPDKFAEIIKSSGAKYYVLTSKHHEGYTMWPSKYSWNWNSVDLGPKRDIVGDMKKAFAKIGGVRFGLYFSQFEWFNRLYEEDKSTVFQQQKYVSMVSMPQMMELINQYQPEVLWSDGDWEAPYQYWNSTQFLAWLYNSSPVKSSIVVNDRWGKGTSCHHGDFYNCQDHFDPGHLVAHKWEDATTLDPNSWGFRRTLKSTEVISVHTIVTKLAKAICCNGNLLLNVGPTHDGRIIPIFEERLRGIGQWLGINGEAVYGTKAWIHQNDTITPNIWYTSTVRDAAELDPRRIFNVQDEANTVVYAFVLTWPAEGSLKLMAPKSTARTKVEMLGVGGKEISWKPYNGGMLIELGSIPFPLLPSTHSWVLRLSQLQSDAHVPKPPARVKFTPPSSTSTFPV